MVKLSKIKISLLVRGKDKEIAGSQINFSFYYVSLLLKVNVEIYSQEPKCSASLKFCT